MLQNSIKISISIEILILALNLVSYDLFLNAQVAFLSSFFIILGSISSYKRFVEQRIPTQMPADDRDELDKIDDPYNLYDEDQEIDTENTNIKTLMKDEKKRIRQNSWKHFKLTSSAAVSIFRLAAYLFLVVSFVVLSKNHHLMLLPYLLFLFIGIWCGYIVGKTVFIRK